MSDILRLYLPDELRRDGYPALWPEIKSLIRGLADNRCQRCRHPYSKGQGEWSRCDDLCTHEGPIRTADVYGEIEDKPGRYEIKDEVIHARWRILTVHHLDRDKANCRWWNLASLCQRCHLTIQTRVNMAQVYPWEHSEWFRLHAAGYYAFVYLNEDLSREETALRLDELLALERIDA